MPCLLLFVRFYDGRYHGSGAWPPSPARLFQALVAGAARGAALPEGVAEAFEWLESLAAPMIAAPPVYAGQSFKNFVPNNDLDAVGGDPARIGEIRTAKPIRPCAFDAAVPLLYAWRYEEGADDERHARAICEIAGNLYQLGRGVDMAWAQGELVDKSTADRWLRDHPGALWRPNNAGGGARLPCPHPGSLMSLTERFKKTRERFKKVGSGRKTAQLFSQAPKPDFRPTSYNSPSTFLLFDIKNADVFVPQSVEQVVALTEKVRDLAVARLKGSAWRRDDPQREACIERIFIGQGAKETDKTRRIRITPLPSIGHAQTERSIRRVLVTVPPDCPIAIADIAWVFSGLALDVNPETGELRDEAALLVVADNDTMLGHYGVGPDRTYRLWRTVTPAALPERAARRRIDPRRMIEEAKASAERLREQAAAEAAARQALRHAGIDAPVQAIRIQREPFEARGQRAEAFATKPRFAEERLWQIEIAFARPVPGPLLIGDGRYLGLGLMAPVRHPESVFAFAIAGGLIDRADPLGLARALRRAVIARVQERIGARNTLPAFFSGHAATGAPARSGMHEHLAFVFDAPQNRLLIVAPHILERRDASSHEREALGTLEDALEDFQELRAGAAGKLILVPSACDLPGDPLFARSRAWKSLVPYRVTRHAKLGDAAAALEADLLAECRRAGLPRPKVEVSKTFAKPRLGLFGLVKLEFHGAVDGPILLGRDRHFGGGLFLAAR
ncbi:MAG TPA: type I-U CRISPR-associated protein Csb2 [Xanthobacteraceae bacterium]|nr:type I-U CRISPR-associated protein Csb2 [Xanthobacteraceae bacterium]